MRKPKDTVKVRRLPKEGEELDLRVLVTRTNYKNPFGTLTIRIPGHAYPVTISAKVVEPPQD